MYTRVGTPQCLYRQRSDKRTRKKNIDRGGCMYFFFYISIPLGREEKKTIVESFRDLNYINKYYTYNLQLLLLGFFFFEINT